VKDKEFLVKNFFGEKGTRKAEIVGDAAVKIDKDTVTISGISIEDIGQTAANIETACKLKKRDRRIFIDGIYTSGKHLQTGEHI
jgi:large subunit ribosomal protein L6